MTEATGSAAVRSAALPYTYDRTHSAAELASDHGGLEPGTETGKTASIAGRLMLRRVQGKLAFGTLADETGRIQLFAPSKTVPEFEAFCALNLGDWIGVSGEIMTTKRGELSVRVDSWTLLAPTRRPFPDKFHGISDADLRYRQRYIDLWVTEESRDRFVKRSKVISLTRRWMEDQGYVEVETPVFHPLPGGALARPFETHHNALDVDLYLRIAPELYLKRLVVGGFPKVFEIARVFRNEGLSTRHNPEFTMMECYEAYADYHRHMDLTEQLITHLATEVCGATLLDWGDGQIDLSGPWRRASLSTLVSEAVGKEVTVRTDRGELIALCEEHGVAHKESYGPGKLLLELYEKLVESTLWDPTFVTDYPAEVSPLARRHRDDELLTERFEGIVGGREICNGFSELCDPDDQRERFVAQAIQRDDGDEEAMVVDEEYLAALEFGLPPTVGLGIGIDRLVMLLTGATSIRDVVLFPTLRPRAGSDSANGESSESDAEDDDSDEG